MNGRIWYVTTKEAFMERAVTVPQLTRENGESGTITAGGMEKAARAVSDFAKDLGGRGLDQILAMAGGAPDGTAVKACDLANSVTADTKTLHDEVRRLLAPLEKP